MKIATSLLLAVCLSTVCATIPLSAMGAGLSPATAWLALLAGVAGAVIYWLTTPASKPLKMGWGEWAAAGLFALFSLRAFCWLVFANDNKIEVLSPNNLGDLPLHLTFIRYFARGAKFWPQNPIYSGVPLHYPAGIDIFSALLHLAGCDDFRMLIWMGLIGSALACYALLRWGGWFATIGFLCNGGIAGWRYFHRFAFHIQDYQADVDWKSIPLALFVTQRGLLYAIPAGVLLLAVWRAQWFRSETEPKPALRMPLWVQVLLYATMPLFHLHTFMFLSALLACWVLLGAGKKLSLEVLDLVLWSVLPGTICVSLVTGIFRGSESAASVVHIHAGWMQEGQKFFPYWFRNFGVLPVLAVAALIWAGWRFRNARETQAALAFVAPSIALFITACFVMFAPWAWDNTKIMIWCYLAILPFIHEMLLAEKDAWAPILRVPAYLMLFFSGFISLLGGLDGSHTGYDIADRSELEPVEFAVRHMPPDATFAGYPTFNHPLLLSGCKMVEGYDGHLMSYGIPYETRLADLNRMMMGAPDWLAIAQRLHVRYLYWGSFEQANYDGSTQPWKNLPVAAAGAWGTIYDLGPATAVTPHSG
jgi:hypothetical protein